LDPESKFAVALFNPRTGVWRDHFTWSEDGLQVIGKTPTGRATVLRLKMNTSRWAKVRRRLFNSGTHPMIEQL
jgi:hypothetical protein